MTFNIYFLDTPKKVEGFQFFKEVGPNENCTTLKLNNDGQNQKCALKYYVYFYDEQKQKLSIKLLNKLIRFNDDGHPYRSVYLVSV